ncbi:sperm acrosome membrane-associated protein 6 isoform X7 [Nannospalax galili]|uniref:sperm acrosome membrane-associated protein 6 isoform X7 n=1 Tax=Nannospalax galili TaxID=1026970 RepID=UPI0004ED6AB9|nr:sperm acrosome membrane-associated protein 6 isoform X7 [Nannospalax galili]XP_029412111.1 sperm acrosome membrane-associated protein 6 isoform X7 [Nannospalax galili]XP_029412112.1 sperm acrosome membrane-associated protein 6 isoform X7 [Nannospalax galili]
MMPWFLIPPFSPQPRPVFLPVGTRWSQQKGTQTLGLASQGSRKALGVSAAVGVTPPSVISPWTVPDVTVTRGNQALFSCVVGFQLPLPELTYSWKFAGGGLRTQDMAYFRDVPGSHGPLARIRPVQPTHRGTFSCVILQDQRPLARLYFFLNGAVRGLERGRGLAGVALPSDVCARGSDRPSPAGGDGAAGHVPGSDELGTAGGGSGGAREAQPRGAAGPAAGADAGQPVLARGHRGARVRECHAAGVVSPSVCIGCPPQPGI